MTHIDLANLHHDVLPVDTPLPPATLRARRRLVLSATIGAGLAGDLLLRYGPIGANATTYFLCVIAGLALLTRSHDEPERMFRRSMLGLALVFAMLFLVRESEVTWFLNGLVVISLLGLAALPRTTFEHFQLFRARIRDVVMAGVELLPYMIAGPVRVLLMRTPVATTDRRSLVAGLARALLIATAPLLVLAPLLSAGDPVFARVLSRYTNIDVFTVLSHAFLIVFFAWPAAGLLTSASGVAQVRLPRPEHGLQFLNRLDVLVTLGAMNLLFMLFLALQVRVLFGGANYLHDTIGLTVAEYARDGFFTLTVATGLTLGVLLVVNALFARDSLASWRVTRLLTLSLIAMLGAVLASTVARMLLYIQAFGLTIERVYAFAFIAWLATVLGWFCFTVLRSREHQFFIGTVTTAAATVLALNIASPDVAVVRNAIWRAQQGETVDLEYLSTELSDDALPLLLDAVVSGTIALPASNAGSPCYLLANDIVGKWDDDHWRSGWTWGRARAKAAVERHRQALNALACPNVEAAPTQ